MLDAQGQVCPGRRPCRRSGIAGEFTVLDEYWLMRAVWYDEQGPAGEVVQFGDQADPEPGPGDVRVRVRFSGVNPGDTKKRRGWLGSVMPFPRVIPHSDGAGVVEAVGVGVDPARIGQRVWV